VAGSILNDAKFLFVNLKTGEKYDSPGAVLLTGSEMLQLERREK
jgi:hypothetical protein